MDPIVLAKLLETLAEVALEGYKVYEQGKATMSETGIAAIHAGLLKVEEATALLRPQVDATLAAAATR